MVSATKAWTLARDRLPRLLELWSDHQLYGPSRYQGEVRFRPLADHPLELDHFNSKRPPKEVFFPQTERLFDFELAGGSVSGVREVLSTGPPKVVVGLRPCDARAMVSLDRLFNWDHVDPYYASRRSGSLLVVLGCREPRPSCFCTSVGGDPHGTEGADLLLTELDDTFHLQALTSGGEALVQSAQEVLRPAGEAQEAARERCQQAAREAFTRQFDTQGLQEALRSGFEHPYWESVARRCLGCGICTYLCPTCHCFDINDITDHGRMWRERTWDTCQFAYYSLHASGHNPRPSQRERQRNRILHKFLYMDERLGGPGCVGCGRCVAHCPENIDIVEAILTLKEAAIREVEEHG